MCVEEKCQLDRGVRTSGSPQEGVSNVIGMTETRTQIAVIGAPSSCDTAVLILRSDAYHLPVLGRVIYFRVPFDGGTDELALATVTGVETVNTTLSPTSPTSSHIASTGAINRMSGDASDTRSVKVKVEAVFRWVEGEWIRYSSTLSNSPPTGTEVELLDQAVVDEILGDSSQFACLGTLRGSDVRIPWTLSSFSGPRGARHKGIVGVSGSGKSVLASTSLAAQLRHVSQGHIVADPQGQWSLEHGTLWSLQGLARSLGRKVTVARLSHSLRLRKDAPLLLSLLEEAGFFRKLAFGAGADDNVAQAKDVLASALKNKTLLARAGIDNWTSIRPDELLRFLLTELYEQLPAGMIYAGRDPQRRVQSTIHRPTHDSDGNPLDSSLIERMAPGALDEGGEHRFSELMAIFSPLASLWSPWSPTGLNKILAGVPDSELEPSDRRRDAWGMMLEVMAPEPGQPAPLLILDLSADLSTLDLSLDSDDEEDQSGAMEAARVLDSVDVKARVLRQLINTLLLAGQREFSKGEPLDLEFWIDEAWQWAPPPETSLHSPAVIDLSNMLAGAARDARKLGIGFTFILQTPTGLRDDIFRQLTALYVGYGLHDPAELKKLAGRVRDSHLALYQTTPPPEATGRYSWFFIGAGLTGLSFGANPIFLDTFTSGEQWLDANKGWINELRRSAVQYLPEGDIGGPLTEIPPRPPLDGQEARHAARTRIVNGVANSQAVSAVAGRKKGARRPSARKTTGGVVPVRTMGE